MKSVSISIKKSVFNDAYYPYIQDDSRFLIFYGGAGSGKSFFVVQRYIYRLLKSEMCNLMVCRAVGDTNRTTTFALFRQVINKWGLTKYFKVNASNMSIYCKINSNSVIFKGLDDVEKLKSTTFVKGEMTDIWIEEASETQETDLKQLMTRLRGGKSKKQIVLSFNPIDINHWLKKRFFDKKQESCVILHTTYKDNKFIDDEYKRMLESFKDDDPYYYAVYCLGQWGVFGRTVFNAKNVQAQIEKHIAPKAVGYFEYKYDGMKISDIRFINDENGTIMIYEKPEDGVPYVIGGDTSGEGSDYFTGLVIDNITKKNIAVLRHEYDEDYYTRQMYCLGKYYNDALIAIEANYTTYPIKELERLGYDNMYIRMREDTYTGKHLKSFGFKTTAITRPLIIQGLVKIMNESPELIIDNDILCEMLTFVRNEKGRPEAQDGSHDDLIMGLAITYYSSAQQKAEKIGVKKVKAKWEHDMYEDYRRADTSGKKYLIEKWGNPF